MNIKKLYFSLIIFLSLFHLLSSSSNSQFPPKEEVELLKKLVFPTAYEVVTGYDNKLKITAISYKVKLKYPSKEVLEFCDRELKKIGWQEYKNPPFNKGTRIWSDFEDGTKGGIPLVHQLFALWNNKEKSKMITLSLRYYSFTLKPKEKLYLEAPNADILNVIVQIGPYAELPNNNGKNKEIDGKDKTWSRLFPFCRVSAQRPR